MKAYNKRHGSTQGTTSKGSNDHSRGKPRQRPQVLTFYEAVARTKEAKGEVVIDEALLSPAEGMLNAAT